MQPVTNSAHPTDDLHSILNRFQTWTGKQPENHNGHKPSATGVREIPMEEAIRQLRSRRGTPLAKQTLATAQQEAATGREPHAAAEPKAPAREAAAPAMTELGADLLPGTQPAARTKTAAPAVKKEPAAKRGPAAQAKAGKPQAASSACTITASTAKRADPRQPETCKSAKRSRPAAKQADPPRRKAEFREILARSVRAESPEKKPERQQRVSVRLSSAEERLLQKRAKEAGMTVSEYLRRSALIGETPRPEAQGNRKELEKRDRQAAPASRLFAATPQSSSGLGGWLSLLRNRFLASPARIAERA